MMPQLDKMNKMSQHGMIFFCDVEGKEKMMTCSACGGLTNGQLEWEYPAALSQHGARWGRPTCGLLRKRTGGEDGVLLILLEKLAAAGFPDTNSTELDVRWTWHLAVTEDGFQDLFQEALVFILGVASWFQGSSLSL